MKLKKTVQVVLLFMGSWAFAQLGVGTATPNASAQLEVIANDKGMLIPRVALASLTDTATMANGNVESLLVYNTTNAADLSPGYYYWANTLWNRLAVQSDIAGLPADVTSTNGSITGTAVDAALVAMDLEVNVDDRTLEVDATNGVQLKDGGIVAAKIADNAVDTAKIGTEGTTDANKVLGTDAAGNPQWQDVATLAASLGEDVTSTNGSITGTAVDAALVAMDLQVNVDNLTLEMDAINGVQLKDAGIATAKIADNAVDGTKIQVMGEVQGAMLFNDGTDWISLPNGTAGQVLTMNAAGDAPEWVSEAVNGPSPRIGEFVYAKSGRSPADGYLPVSPGTIANGAVDYPLWAAQYPEFISGNDIVFPNDVSGMFLRNIGTSGVGGSYPAPEGVFQANQNKYHRHSHTDAYNVSELSDDSNDRMVGSDGVTSTSRNTGYEGNQLEPEARPNNRAYQLYTIVDTYE